MDLCWLSFPLWLVYEHQAKSFHLPVLDVYIGQTCPSVLVSERVGR